MKDEPVPNEYTLKRRKEGAAEVKEWLKNPLSYKKALEQATRLADQEDADSNQNITLKRSINRE